MSRGVFKWALAAVAAAVMLAGCAHPQLVELGDLETAVVERLGEPMAKTRMEDGTVRWTYSLQPYGQEVWWLFVDETGHVVSREQGLQEKYFNLIRPGVSTEDDVWALCTEVHLPPRQSARLDVSLQGFRRVRYGGVAAV